MSQVSGADWHSSLAHLFFLANFFEPRRADDLPRSLDWEQILGASPQQVARELLDLGGLEFVDAAKPLAERMLLFHVTTLKEMLRMRDSTLAGNKEELIVRLIQLDSEAMEEALREVAPYTCSEQARVAIEEYLKRASQAGAAVPSPTDGAVQAVPPVDEQGPGDQAEPTTCQAPSLPEPGPSLTSSTPTATEKLSAADHLRCGTDLGLRGDYAGALHEFNQAVEIDPGNAVSYYCRGLAHERLGDHRSSLDDYHRAASLDPQQALYYAGRGMAYRKLGDPRLAIAEYDRAVSLDPTLAAAYHNRGVAYEHLGDYRRALQDYDKSIELDSGAALSYLGRGLACEHLSDGSQAVKAYQAVLHLSADPQVRAWAQQQLQNIPDLAN